MVVQRIISTKMRRDTGGGQGCGLPCKVGSPQGHPWWMEGSHSERDRRVHTRRGARAQPEDPRTTPYPRLGSPKAQLAQVLPWTPAPPTSSKFSRQKSE